MHYGWIRMQEVDHLVAKEERKEFPLIHVSTTQWDYVRNVMSDTYVYFSFSTNCRAPRKSTPI
jgi:hypothetical protein